MDSQDPGEGRESSGESVKRGLTSERERFGNRETTGLLSGPSSV